MKQLAFMLATGLALAGFAVGSSRAEVVVIDDFDQYANTSYVQEQKWSLWRRFGAATTDGIYSIAGGASGRGANYGVSWAQGNAGYVRYTFPSPKGFEVGTVFAMDISVTVSLPGTQVFLLVSNGDSAAASTTTYRTRIGELVNHTDYRTFSFSITEDTVRRVSGTASLPDVLKSLSSVTLMFTNADGSGAQSIQFDNFTVSAGPAR